MSKPKKPTTPAPATTPDASAAFESIKAELLALSPDELATVNIDIPQAVSVALGVLPGLSALRPTIAKALPLHPIELLDKLETYALAAWYAHLQVLPPGNAASPVKLLLDEASALRMALLTDAEALAARGLLDAGTVAEIRRGKGNIDMANDLVALASLFTTHAGAIQGKTAATPAEVSRAGALGPMLLAALGARSHADAGPSDASDKRARAFTLFLRAYDATRRAVHYLHWDEGDADVLAPSLYKGRGHRGRAAEESAPVPGEAAASDAEGSGNAVSGVAHEPS